MHIHSNPMSSQMLGLNATQGTQQAAAARREALSVRKKLTDFATATDSEDVSRVASDPGAEPDSGSRQNRNPQSDAESFKSVFFSFKV
jgi:hypothetical protein